MAEIFGVATGAIGAVGLLGQLFDGCVKAYSYFTAAANLDADAARLLTKVRIEEMRLVVWGREWGVAEGKLEARLAAATGGAGAEAEGMSGVEEGVGRLGLGMGGGGAAGGVGLLAGGPQLRILAEHILTELYNTITDFRKLQERYGLVEEGAGAALATGTGKAGGAGNGGGGGGKTLGVEEKASNSGSTKDGRRSPNKKSAAAAVKEALVGGPKNPLDRNWRRDMALRAKWVIGDKEKFISLLRDLKDFNDGLEQLFPPSRVPSLQRAWQHELLQSAQRSVSQLSLLEHAAGQTYPQLHRSAGLKKLRINLDAAPQASFRPTFALKVPRDALTLAAVQQRKGSNGNGNGTASGGGPVIVAPRSTAAYLDATTAGRAARTDVLIEWVAYDRDDPEERLVHLRRLDDLARMLRGASERHPDLHTLDAVGYTDDRDGSRYGVVYKMPAAAGEKKKKGADLLSPDAPTTTTPPAATAYSSLLALLSSPDLKTPPLDARVHLAHSLAVALWSLHSLDWLHKSLCAANVLFFPAPSSSAVPFTASSTTPPPPPPLQGEPASSPPASRPQSPPTAAAANTHQRRGSSSGGLGAGGSGNNAVPDVSRPYLVGFDASRPEVEAEMSVAPRNPSILDLHRHPRLSPGGGGGGRGSGGGVGVGAGAESAGGLLAVPGARVPYCKAFDIYSLGLVLLEIGLWKPLQTYYQRHYSADRWRDRVVLPVLLPGLDAKTGRRYRDVVERCLTAREDMTSAEAGQLMEEVVGRLEGIRV